MNSPALAYVVNSLNPGGTEKLVVDMSLAFTADFKVVVICLDEPGIWVNNLRDKNIPVYCVWRQAGLDLKAPVRLANYFRKHRIKIIHAHQCSAWFYSALSRLNFSEPYLLLEEHGRFFPEVENKKRIFFNRLIVRRLTHRFVAVSKDVRERLQRYEGLEKNRIQVIYNGVQEQSAISHNEREQRRADLGFGPKDFVVGTVGRIDSIKNLPMLVKALHKSSKVLPSIKGLIVGDGPAFGEIKELVKELDLSEILNFTGYREDARDLIPCLDLFVLSSFSEGISMALLEAMVAGVPVAVTEVGGNPEIVNGGKTGWVIPSCSVKSLDLVIQEAVTDPEKRLGFGEAGRRRYKRRFTFDRMIQDYRRVYREMIEAH